MKYLQDTECSTKLDSSEHEVSYRIQSVPLNLTVLNMKYLQDTECSTKLDSSEHEVSAGYRVFH